MAIGQEVETIEPKMDDEETKKRSIQETAERILDCAKDHPSIHPGSMIFKLSRYKEGDFQLSEVEYPLLVTLLRGLIRSNHAEFQPDLDRISEIQISEQTAQN